MSVETLWSIGFWMAGGSLLVLQAVVASAVHRRIDKTLRAAQMRNDTPQSGPVSIIIPVWGRDEFTAENFASWANQANSESNEIIFSFQDEADPAIAPAESLETRSKKKIVVNPVKEGFNGKMSNLHFGVGRATHDVLVWCDSDTQAAPRFCEHVFHLLRTKADVVFGIPVQCRAHNVWARAFAQLYNVEILGFLAPAIEKTGATGVGTVVGTRRETLEKIGGIDAFKNTVADGREIGKRARALGMRVALGPLVAAPVGRMTFRLLMDKMTRAVLVEKGKAAVADTVMYRTMYAYIGLILAGLAVMSVPLLVTGVLSALLRLGSSSVIWTKATGEKRLLLDVFLFDAVIVSVYLSSFVMKKTRWGGIRYTVSGNGTMTAQDR